MSRDANDLAKDWEIQHRNRAADAPETQVVRGTLTIWESIPSMLVGDDWIAKSIHASLDLSKPGVLIAYEPDGAAEIFVLQPGWYMNFVPDDHDAGQ